MKIIFYHLVKFAGRIVLGLWCLLTIVVVLFLVDRFIHPHTKGISNVDLQDYGYITLFALPVFVLTLFISSVLSPSAEERC